MIYDILEDEEVYLHIKIMETHDGLLDIMEGVDTTSGKYISHLCKLVEIADVPDELGTEGLIHYNGKMCAIVFDWTSDTISEPRRSVWFECWESFVVEDIPTIEGPLYICRSPGDKFTAFRFSTEPTND